MSLKVRAYTYTYKAITRYTLANTTAIIHSMQLQMLSLFAITQDTCYCYIYTFTFICTLIKI